MTHLWQFAPASGLWFCWLCFALDRNYSPAVLPPKPGCSGRTRPDITDPLKRWDLVLAKIKSSS